MTGVSWVCHNRFTHDSNSSILGKFGFIVVHNATAIKVFLNPTHSYPNHCGAWTLHLTSLIKLSDKTSSTTETMINDIEEPLLDNQHYDDSQQLDRPINSNSPRDRSIQSIVLYLKLNFFFSYRFYASQILFFLVGLSQLLPWNFLITATDVNIKHSIWQIRLIIWIWFSIGCLNSVTLMAQAKFC